MKTRFDDPTIRNLKQKDKTYDCVSNPRLIRNAADLGGVSGYIHFLNYCAALLEGMNGFIGVAFPAR